ncbi:PhrA family quorum-sensing system peptide [Streptococcus merionis]|uniref:PhrA family quorum-sensing system peptide n=1 Tax=Streptococcus merionis TaxID=400065 RepID=UPI000BA411FA|nr:PhrA family quorum-sensing system peptide [Streptococcus merionis]
MKKNTIIKSLACLLLGYTLLCDTVHYQQLFNNTRFDVQIQPTKKTNGLDVGKAD